MAFGTTATTPKPLSGLEYKESIPIPLSGSTSIPAAATNEFLLFQHDRRLRFRQFGFFAQQTVVSGVPSTNSMRLEIWKYPAGTTIATKICQATITGWTTGTLIQRGVHVSIATLSGMLSLALAVSTAESIISAKFVGTNSLSRGLIGPVITYRADVID